MSSSGSSVIRKRIQNLTLSAVLTAFSILIPMIMPVKVIIGPASFTLASHVPIFIAMFLSPEVAVIVALGDKSGLLYSWFSFCYCHACFDPSYFCSYWCLSHSKIPQLLKEF